MIVFQRVIGTLVVLLVCLSPLLSQTGEAGSPTVFGDGISMTIPTGWETTIIDTESRARANGMSPHETNPIKLLLHARSPGEGRSSLTIMRDESFGSPGGGPMLTQMLLARLSEMAGEQGYRADRPSTRGSPVGKDTTLLGEIVGVSADGKRRVFACVSISQFPSLDLRCYWQWDESDVAMRNTFEQWLAAITFGNQKVTALLDGNAGEVVIARPTPEKIVVPTAPVAKSTPTPRSVSTTPATASPTASPVAPVVVALSKEAAQIASTNQDSLVVIEGSKGRGSGFVCKDAEGKSYLVTNTHVLSDNPQPKFNTMSGTSLTPGVAALAVESDIFRALAPEGTPSLETMTVADGSANIGDSIVVLGNSEGAGVVKALEGKIVGLGPNLVEVDAPFVSGNSGSPIIHLPTGKVIGIATYLLIRKVDEGGKGEIETTVRRFGYRLDKVKAWEPLDWKRFYVQSAQVDRIQETSAEFEQLFDDAREKKMSSGNFNNSAIKRAVENLERSGRSGSRMSDADLSRLKRDFMGSLRIAAMMDVNAFDNRSAYDYFRRQVADEKKFRDDLAVGLTRVINSTR